MTSRMDKLRYYLKTDDLTKHSIIITMFSTLTGLFNYLYQIVMGRLLTPEQYGTLVSLIALFTIIMVFARTIQTSIAKFSSRFKAVNETGKVAYLRWFSLRYSITFGAVIFGIISSLTLPLSGFLNISNYWYVIIIAASFLLTFAVSTDLGMLQGLQRFLPLGVSSTLATLFKLILGVLLVYLGLGIYGGLLALVLAPLFTLSITAYFLRDLSRTSSNKFNTKGIFSYTGLALVAILCYLVLISVDVILAKHFLSATEAGNYSAISTLGKLVLLAPGGIALALFPKTSNLFEKGGEHLRLLGRALVLTLLMAGVIVLIYLFFSNYIVHLAFGDKYTISSTSLFKYGLAMLFFAVSSLLINYFLSINAMKVGYFLVIAVIIELCLISLFHSNIEQIINMLLISGVTSLVVMLPLVFRIWTRDLTTG